MDALKLRDKERLVLLESMITDRCDEISEISYSLLQNPNLNSRSRHQQRLSQLHSEIRFLWQLYVILVPNKIFDLR